MNPYNHGPPTRYVSLRVAYVPGMPGAFSPLPRVSDPGMHAGIANQPFSLKSMAGKTFPAFPAHAQPTFLRVW